jgi:hypothetical protein
MFVLPVPTFPAFPGFHSSTPKFSKKNCARATSLPLTTSISATTLFEPAALASRGLV